MKDKEVSGMELKAECYKPSYDDLKMENERFCELYRKSQRLIHALENSLGMQADEIIRLEQERNFFKEQYYRENKRANELFEKLEKLEERK